MKWTKERPTQEGLYLVRLGNHRADVIRLESSADGQDLYAEFVGSEIPYNFADILTDQPYEWAGPIEPPEESD